MGKFMSLCRKKTSKQKTAWFIATGKWRGGDRKPVFTMKHATENKVCILDVCQKMPHIKNLQIVLTVKTVT